jgi:hypothetical protein
MSYSFQFRAANKVEALQRARGEFDAIVEFQPAHQQDRAIALATVANFLAALSDDDSKDIQVNVHGSVSWEWVPEEVASKVPLTHASVGVSVHHVAKGSQDYPTVSHIPKE